MPNAQGRAGLIPVRHYGGGTVQLNNYAIATGLAANIGLGDPVKSTGTTKQITIATANDAVRGVFQGVNYIASDGTPVFSRNWVTGTALQTGSVATALVVDDPNVLFEIQASAGVASVTVTAGGSSYETAPTVTFTGGGGTGAAGTAVLAADAVDSVTMTNQGSGYTSAPTVTFTGGGGADATGTAVLEAGAVAADIGAGADYFIGTPNTLTGVSTTELDSSTISASGTLALKIVELIDRPNNAYGGMAKVHVLINKHELKASTAAV